MRIERTDILGDDTDGDADPGDLSGPEVAAQSPATVPADHPGPHGLD
jgi:hypothetical protein